MGPGFVFRIAFREGWFGPSASSYLNYQEIRKVIALRNDVQHERAALSAEEAEKAVQVLQSAVFGIFSLAGKAGGHSTPTTARRWQAIVAKDLMDENVLAALAQELERETQKKDHVTREMEMLLDQMEREDTVWNGLKQAIRDIKAWVDSW